jgi:hypothetical protein
MRSTIYVLALCLIAAFAIHTTSTSTDRVFLKKGNLMLSIRTSDEPVIKHRMDITSKSKA